jgi:hypothetical protein
VHVREPCKRLDVRLPHIVPDAGPDVAQRAMSTCRARCHEPRHAMCCRACRTVPTELNIHTRQTTSPSRERPGTRCALASATSSAGARRHALALLEKETSNASWHSGTRERLHCTHRGAWASERAHLVRMRAQGVHEEYHAAEVLQRHLRSHLRQQSPCPVACGTVATELR